MKIVLFLKKEMILQENDNKFLVNYEKLLFYYVDIKRGLYSWSTALAEPISSSSQELNKNKF